MDIIIRIQSQEGALLHGDFDINHCLALVYNGLQGSCTLSVSYTFQVGPKKPGAIGLWIGLLRGWICQPGV